MNAVITIIKIKADGLNCLSLAAPFELEEPPPEVPVEDDEPDVSSVMVPSEDIPEPEEPLDSEPELLPVEPEPLPELVSEPEPEPLPVVLVSVAPLPVVEASEPPDVRSGVTPGSLPGPLEVVVPDVV